MHAVQEAARLEYMEGVNRAGKQVTEGAVEAKMQGFAAIAMEDSGIAIILPSELTACNHDLAFCTKEH